MRTFSFTTLIFSFGTLGVPFGCGKTPQKQLIGRALGEGAKVCSDGKADCALADADSVVTQGQVSLEDGSVAGLPANHPSRLLGFSRFLLPPLHGAIRKRGLRAKFSRFCRQATCSSDYHTDNPSDLRDSIVHLSLLKTLLRGLKSTRIAGDKDGRSLHDITAVCQTTEFDRSCARGIENSTLSNPGAGHGESGTFLMGGGAMVNGRLFGARSTTSSGQHANPASLRSFGRPVPINAEGSASWSGGDLFGQRSFLPTLLAAFELSVPLQQITEAKIMHFVLKKGT